MKTNIEKNILIKMIVACVLGVAIILGGVFALSSVLQEDKSDNKAMTSDNEGEQEDDTPLSQDKNFERGLVLISDVNQSTGEMDVVDVDSGAQITLKSTGATMIEDEYGTQIVLEKIMPGYLVNVKYGAESYMLDSIKIAGNIQIIRNIDNFVVNENNQTVQIGSDIYTYDQNVIVRREERPVDVTEISVADDVVVRAHKGKVWSVLVESGHGFLRLHNQDAYIDGQLEVGNRESYTIVSDMKVPMKTGMHQIVISHEGMTPYTASIFIEEGEEFVVDLGDLAPRVSKVQLDIVQPNAIAYIDGKKIENPKEERQLDYGEYPLRVESPGYVTWEGVLVVNQAYIVQRVDMEVEPLYIYISGPEGASFYVDNVLKGKLKANEPLGVPITPGGHTLQLRKTDYRTWEKNVFIEDTGEDYYYTVPALTELPTVPVPPVIEEENTMPEDTGDNAIEDSVDNNVENNENTEEVNVDDPETDNNTENTTENNNTEVIETDNTTEESVDNNSIEESEDDSIEPSI